MNSRPSCPAGRQPLSYTDGIMTVRNAINRTERCHGRKLPRRARVPPCPRYRSAASPSGASPEVAPRRKGLSQSRRRGAASHRGAALLRPGARAPAVAGHSGPVTRVPEWGRPIAPSESEHHHDDAAVPTLPVPPGLPSDRGVLLVGLPRRRRRESDDEHETASLTGARERGVAASVQRPRRGSAAGPAGSPGPPPGAGCPRGRRSRRPCRRRPGSPSSGCRANPARAGSYVDRHLQRGHPAGRSDHERGRGYGVDGEEERERVGLAPVGEPGPAAQLGRCAPAAASRRRAASRGSSRRSITSSIPT